MAHKDTIAAASILEIKNKFEVATMTEHEAVMANMQQESTMLLNKIAQLCGELEKKEQQFPAKHLLNRKRKHVTTSTLPSALSSTASCDGLQTQPNSPVKSVLNEACILLQKVKGISIRRKRKVCERKKNPYSSRTSRTPHNIEQEQPNQNTYTQFFSCDHCDFRSFNHFSVRKHLSLKHM